MTDQEDFLRFLAEYGFTEQQARAGAEQTGDMIPMPAGFDSIELGPSPIEGVGMFARVSAPAGAILAPARLNGCRTPAGRYVNHSPRANAIFHRIGENLYLIAAARIGKGEEVTVDYRQSLRVNGWGVEPIQEEVEKTRRLSLDS